MLTEAAEKRVRKVLAGDYYLALHEGTPPNGEVLSIDREMVTMDEQGVIRAKEHPNEPIIFAPAEEEYTPHFVALYKNPRKTWLGRLCDRLLGRSDCIYSERIS